MNRELNRQKHGGMDLSDGHIDGWESKLMVRWMDEFMNRLTDR